jgi:hypothetical protein
MRSTKMTAFIESTPLVVEDTELAMRIEDNDKLSQAIEKFRKSRLLFI